MALAADRGRGSSGSAGCVAHRRRRHAGGHRAVELAVGNGRGGGWFRARQLAADHRRLAGGRQRTDPHPDHVRGHEPVPARGHFQPGALGRGCPQRRRRLRGQGPQHVGRRRGHAARAGRACRHCPRLRPGSGQAQHAVRDLSRRLEDRGTEVVFGIHPVAGRMPAT